jgi:hypothetical protein
MVYADDIVIWESNEGTFDKFQRGLLQCAKILD